MKLNREFAVLGGLVVVIALVEATVLLYFFKKQFVVASGELVLSHWSSFVFMLCLLFTGFVLVLMIGHRLYDLSRAEAHREQDTPRNMPSRKQSSNRKSGNDKRSSGQVKWFNGSKGYGFITNEQGVDVFVHYKSIEGKRRILHRGQEVDFIEKQEGDGLKAHDVRVLDPLH